MADTEIVIPHESHHKRRMNVLWQILLDHGKHHIHVWVTESDLRESMISRLFPAEGDQAVSVHAGRLHPLPPMQCVEWKRSVATSNTQSNPVVIEL